MKSRAKRKAKPVSKAKAERISLPGHSHLFRIYPIPAAIIDYSRVKEKLDDLSKGGVHDIRKYLTEHPTEVISLIKRIKVLAANEAAFRLLEAGNLKDAPSSLHRLLNKITFDSNRDLFASLAEGRMAFRTVATIKTFKGNERHVLVKPMISPLHLGSPSRVLLSLVDITDLMEAEKEIREAEAKYRTIVGSIPYPLIIMDAETGTIVEANQSAAEFLGLPAEEVIGMHFTEICPGKETKDWQGLLRMGPNGGISIPKVVVIRRRNGAGTPVAVRSALVEIKGRRCAVIVCRELDGEPAGSSGTGLAKRAYPDHSCDSGLAGQLSRRELEVVKLIALGQTSRQIAELLFVSVKTIETHRSRVMEKLGFHKTADLVRFAVRTGLLEDVPPVG